MCFSPSPPPPIPKAILSSNLTLGYECRSGHPRIDNCEYRCEDYNRNNSTVVNKEPDNMQRQEDMKNLNESRTDEETSSDYKQWLHAMKLVARLPGGIPPEFRRKLWLSLADKYLKSKNIDWTKEEEKCFCEKWREDDEELGIQIVKDLHRTGSTLCTGPAADLNQAKLKKILLGYARYNPEVGYCQGFNMLGALILQVMDKNESESIKVMIYLVEGILPTGYFCGSMGGLQADMAVFRELMQTKLPRLAKHLQKLQGPIENAFEPPLTNVFTMQWFLTMFCTCLPMSCVLRVWDLVLIEGSDVLLRTALALWSLLEERVLSARSADDFYGKMGSFSSELLNGHLIDSNGLIEKVVQLGPIADIQKLRDKHLYNIAPTERQQGLQLYYDDDEPGIDEDSRLAVATVWGIPWGRRGSQGQPNNVSKQAIESKDRIALDISLLKKQYDRLRERQKQAHIILTTACSAASRQSTSSSTSTAPLPVNQLLSGRPAIVTNKGRRSGPPSGAVPPARKPSLPAVLQDKPLEKQLRRGETLYWRDAKDTKSRRDSLSWKEIKAERTALISSGSIDGLKSQKIRSGRLGKSDSSSYSEESDDNEVEEVENASSTDTSLCDEEMQPMTNGIKQQLLIESIKKTGKTIYKSKRNVTKQRNQTISLKEIGGKARPKSWAPSNTEIPFVLMTTDSPNNSADENPEPINIETKCVTDNNMLKEEKAFIAEETQTNFNETDTLKWKNQTFPATSDVLVIAKIQCSTDKDSQESVINDVEPIFSIVNQVPSFDNLKSTSTEETISILSKTTRLGCNDDKEDNIKTFDVSDEGVTNEYFERINNSERPKKLNLLYSLNEDENIRDAFKIQVDSFVKSNKESLYCADDNSLNTSKNIRCMDLLVDYSEKSSAACIEEAKTEITTTLQAVDSSVPISTKQEYTGNSNEILLKKSKSSAEKRRDPRRLTLTRSSTMDIEKRYQALEKRLSMEVCTKYKRLSDENEFHLDSEKHSIQNYNMNPKNEIEVFSKEDYVVVDKNIPSTADLEERFENMQQQLVRDRKKIKSPCDSENTEKTDLNNSAESNISRNPTSIDKKVNSPKKQDDHTESNEKIESEKISNAKHHFEEKPLQSSKTDSIEATNKAENRKTTVEGSLKRTTSETNVLQNKKEPPDDDDVIIEKDSKRTVDPSASAENSIAISSQAAEENSKEIINLKNSKPVETNETIEEYRESSKKTADRTSPPSTEELEKRFCALEEQMSSIMKESDETFNSSMAISEKMEERGATGLKRKNQDSNKTAFDSRKSVPDATNINAPADSDTSSSKIKLLSEINTKRRLSEPPTTEDLEKRYDIFKRRMSSRNFEPRTFHKNIPTLEPQQDQKTNQINSPTKLIEEDANKHSPPSIENLEERFEKLQNKNDSKKIITTHSPPSTENLEKRFENLQSKSDQFDTPKSNNDPKTKNSPAENVQPTSNGNNTKGNSNATLDKDEVKIVDNKGKEFTASISENAGEEDVSPKKKPVNVLSRNSNKIKIKLIEELQAKIKESSKNTDINNSVENKKAVVKELEMKMNSSPEKLLKPTQITTRRRAPAQSSLLPSHSFNDETLESHATSAYRRSGKYEPANSANRKMVRRFSDTPSRADLENRLQFLEEQLSKTVCMQRRSSDSEVASNSHIKHKASMTHAKPLSNSLEYRVQELEKRVNDNRTISMGVECTSVNGKTPDPEIEVSQVDLDSDAVAVTGKELVRYSSYGEAGHNEHQNPINISINIQMTLNKDGAGTKKSIDVSKTDDLDRRLQFLEQRLKTSQVHDTVTCQNATDDVNESVNRQDQEKKSGDAEENDNQRLQKTISKNTENVCQAVKQDTETLTTSETCTLPKSAENIENKTEIMEAKPNGTDSLTEIPKDNVDKPCQAEKINHQAENTNAIEETTSGELKHNNNSLKQSSLSKEDKQIENSTSEDQNKENEIINLTEQHQSSKRNSTTEMKQKNVKEAEQNIKIPDNELHDNKTSVELKEPSSSTFNRSTESRLNENSNTDAKGNPEIENVSYSTDPTQFVPVEVNKKTLVLLLGNEPKAVKVRRLTRANTEELEDLFQALEKQLSNREQVKISEKTLKAESHKTHQTEIEASKAMSDLANEIVAFSKSETDISEETKSKQKKQEEEFDWGIDPIKYHLKKKTVYLPSTKELEARFRSLERQIKLLEDVEKIDVEHRLIEIERKIKLQYSLSHEKDLNKFLELCEGKDPDEMKISLDKHQDRTECCDQKCTAKHTSPHRLAEPLPSNSSLEYRYRSVDSKRSKSKQNLKKQPIHPLEMLLDPSPDDSVIPTTGELEHRIRVMEENRITPSPPLRKSRSQSPPVKCQHNKTKPNTHILETMTASPTERELPTAEELEARLEALEKEQCFNFKMQKNFQQFNQKLKDVVSPSLSSDDIKSSEKHCDSGHTKIHAFSAAKQNKSINALGPKSIRFREEDNSESLTQNEIMLKKDILDSKCSTKGFQQNPTVQEGLGVMGIRLMRETSPLRRKGTHTGVPLRTGENINDQLTSIKNSIKSIDSLCEEKPYRNERCQQYIDALFSDSTYFAHKKSSLEDLASRNLSRSTSREIGPSIRISDHSPAFSRSMGSADSIKSSSPLRSTSPLQYRSNRDLRRELSPRRRRDEDREEHESRVRRDYLLSNNINCSHSLLSHTSHSSLTKFHKVDSQLIPNDVEHELEESLRHPKFSTIDNLINLENTNTSNNVNTTLQRTLNAEVMTPDSLKSHPLDRPTSPFRQTIPLLSSHTPVYTPAKLEIRHTTVTSTFYDRVLAEKQLEKQHHFVPTNNQPSIISPILERHIKPTYQQQTTKSPTKPLNTDLNDTLTFTDASTGNYQHTFQSHIQAKNHC